jgi:hypothetical protein
VAALFIAVLIVSEVVGLAICPQPDTVIGWFTLFQSNGIIGLQDFWGLEVPMYALFPPLYLALYVALKRANEGCMAIATALALLGVGVFLATNNPFSMLSLSSQYAAARTDAQRSMLLAAGQALLANTGQRAVGGFNIGLFLVSVAGLMVSWVMLQSHSFSTSTAHMGILANALSLVDYLREALAAPLAVAVVVILAGALLLVVWFALVGRRVWELGHDAQEVEANPK